MIKNISKTIVKTSEEGLKEKIVENFRKEGLLFILRDSSRVYKIDFIDSNGPKDSKFYVMRTVKNGEYKKVSKDSIVDFTTVKIDNNKVLCETYIGKINIFKKMSLEDHLFEMLKI